MKEPDTLQLFCDVAEAEAEVIYRQLSDVITANAPTPIICVASLVALAHTTAFLIAVLSDLGVDGGARDFFDERLDKSIAEQPRDE